VGVTEFAVSTSAKNGTWNFTNVTMYNGSSIRTTWATAAVGPMNVHWYANVYVNYTDGNPAEGINISVKNVNDVLANTAITDSFGNAKIPLLEYTRYNNTNYSSYSNYTINATTSLESSVISVNMTQNQNLVFTFTAPVIPAVTATETIVSGGGSVGVASSESLISGFTKVFSIGDVINFKLNSEAHKFSLLSVKGNKVTIQFSSNIQKATLAVGEEKSFDLNNDSENDVFVRINNITGIKADITIKLLTKTLANLPTLVNNTQPTSPEPILAKIVALPFLCLTHPASPFLLPIIALLLIIPGVIFLKRKATEHRIRKHIKTHEFARKR